MPALYLLLFCPRPRPDDDSSLTQLHRRRANSPQTQPNPTQFNPTPPTANHQLPNRLLFLPYSCAHTCTHLLVHHLFSIVPLVHLLLCHHPIIVLGASALSLNMTYVDTTERSCFNSPSTPSPTLETTVYERSPLSRNRPTAQHRSTWHTHSHTLD